MCSHAHRWQHFLGVRLPLHASMLNQFASQHCCSLGQREKQSRTAQQAISQNCSVKATVHLVSCRPSCPTHSWWGSNVIRCHQFTQYLSPFLLKQNVIKSFRSSQEFWSLLWALQMNNAIRLFFTQSGQLSMEAVIFPQLGKTCAQGKKRKKKNQKKNGKITAQQIVGREAKNMLL